MIDVLCVGDLDVDIFAAVPVLPGPDQKVSGRHLGRWPGGMAANAAVAIARLGGRARLLAAVGDDEAGAFALDGVAREGVDAGFVARRAHCRTFTCVVLLSPSGEKALVRLETDAYLPRPTDAVAEVFDGVRHVHVTYGDAALALHVLRTARARGATTSLDLERPDLLRAPGPVEDVLSLVDTLFVNRDAWRALVETGRCDLARGHDRPMEVMLTLGKDGCLRRSAGLESRATGFAVSPIDTTGAGDCFAGAYLVERLRGEPPDRAMRFANAAAALSTLGHGAQSSLPTRFEVEALLARTGTEAA